MGIGTEGLSRAVGQLRSQAVRLDAAGDLAQQALFISDLQSPVLGRLRERAEQFRRVADELQVRIDIVTAYELDPGSIDPAHATAALTAGLDSINTLAELNHRIDNWNGTDNDPRLDEMLRQRQDIQADLFGDETALDGSRLDPFTAAVAEQNGLSHREAEFVVLSVEVEDLTRQMGLQFDAETTDEWERLDRLRAEALNKLLANDAALNEAVGIQLNRGEDLFTAVSLAVTDVYGDATIAELQEAMAFHSAEDSFGLALMDLNEQHTAAIVAFTGVDPATVNPRVASVAQTEGLSYNALVDQINQSITSGDMEGEPLSHIAINGTIPNEATLLWNLSQQDLFEELDTALEGDRSEYDGQVSLTDLNTVVNNPANFSDAAVAAAEMLLADDELRLRIDTAGSGQFLDGIVDGSHSYEGADGIISMGDVQQHVTNSLVYGLLEPQADSLDTNNDGQITRAEFESQLNSIDPDGNLAAAINYALSEEAFSDRDQRSTWNKIGDGLYTINSLNPLSPTFYQRLANEPGELLGDYGSFAKGLLWEFPKGLAVLAYDTSSLVPGSPAYLIETHTNWGGEGHRGVALLTGLKEAGAVGLTLVPGTPQFEAELERVRRSGRFSDHAGIGLVTTLADWETFVDDPAQWFGTITGDVLLGVATGGAGTVATRGAAGLRAVSRFTRTATNLDNLRNLRHLAGTRLQTALANTRQLAAHTRTFLANEVRNIGAHIVNGAGHAADALSGLGDEVAFAGIPATVRPPSQIAESLFNLAKRLENPHEHPLWDELSVDPAKGPGHEATVREAEVAINAEHEGIVPKIAERDDSGASEFIDVEGQPWDIKTFPSKWTTPEVAIRKIELELKVGENILVDTADMTDADVAALKQMVKEREWEPRVKFWPNS